MQAKKVILLCLLSFISMETEAQELGYFHGAQFYLIDKKAYETHLQELEANQSVRKQRKHLKHVLKSVYDKIKDIDFDVYAQTHAQDFKRYRDYNVVGGFTKKLKYEKNYFDNLKKVCAMRVQNFDAENWDEMRRSYYYKLYFHYLVNQTDKFFWFLGEPYHRFSLEFMHYVEGFSEQWQNIFAMESKLLNPIKIGHKWKEDKVTEEDEYNNLPTDEYMYSSSNNIVQDIALRELQEKILANLPEDKRLEEERNLMLEMLARCLSGECYLVMQRL